MLTVAWVGDEPEVPDALRDPGFEVVTVPPDEADGADADCVVYDADAAEAEGFVERLRAGSPDTPRVLVGGGVEAGGVNDAAAKAVFDRVEKVEGWGEVLADVVANAVGRRTHTSYPVPEDEEERLEQVNEYVDLEADGAFDGLTEIGSRHFGTDMCLVGLVDRSRELFLSCQGAPVDDLPREQTVCTYGILEETVLVVDDMRDDPRFENREDLLSLGMRFYAGAPLVTDLGTHVGSFCVMDAEPRGFGEEDRGTLTLFAQEAMDKLRLLRSDR